MRAIEDERTRRRLQGTLRLQRTPPRTLDSQTYGSHRTTSASSPASRRPASPVLCAAPARHRRGGVLQRGGEALQRDRRRARPRVLRHLPGRVRLPRRPLRLRQVDRDEAPDQGARADRGRDPRRRPRPAEDPAPARAVLPPQPRRDLPGLQAAAEPHGLRERRVRAAGHGRRPARDPRQGAGHPAPHGPAAPSCTTTPTSSPAASSSASRSRARSSTTRRC